MNKIFRGLLALFLKCFMASAICTWTSTYNDRSIEVCRRICYQELRTIEDGPRIYNCSKTDILEIHSYLEYPSIACHVFIENSTILSLEPNEHNWSNVTELHIQDTHTSKIIPGFFNTFNDLKVLSIVDNKITEIVSGAFSSLTVLETLNLTHNLIDILAEHSFSGMLNLKRIDLSSNKLISLPEGIFQYQNFLSFVDFSQNKIKKVGSIFNIVTLQMIDLSQNQLINFDFDQLQNITQLTKIDLSTNLIGLIQKLDAISIDEINLSNNKIQLIPKMGNVSVFNISRNYIQAIESNILNKTIKSLDISHNNVTVLNANAFENMTKLEYLDFDHNNLNSLPIDIFAQTIQLRHLDLSFNHINQIPFGLFNNLYGLTYLDLSENNMMFDFHTLITLKSLNVLKFQNNRITNFDASELLTHFKDLKVVTLSDDSWSCSELASAVHKFQLNNIEITRGQNTKIANILGISCKDNADLKEESVLFERFNAKSKFNTNYPNNYSVKLFDDSLKKTTFFKYLKTVAQYISENDTMNSTKNVSRNEFIRYLNENFTNTQFSKYVQDMKDISNNTFSLIAGMNNFFNVGFNDTNFYKNVKFLENNLNTNLSDKKVLTFLARVENKTENLSRIFNSTIFNLTTSIKNIMISQNANFNEFLSGMKEILALKPKTVRNGFLPYEIKEEISSEHTSVDTNLILNNIFLLLVLCCLLTVVYRIFYKPKEIDTQEQVQLM